MRISIVALISLLSLATARANEETKSYYEPATFFRVQILPILEKRCFECHSKQHEIEGGLALDSKAGWTVGGDHGPAITPKDLKKSPLIQSIRHHDSDSAMPPDEKLPPIEIALLETWVLLGAPDPRTDPALELKSKTGGK